MVPLSDYGMKLSVSQRLKIVPYENIIMQTTLDEEVYVGFAGGQEEESSRKSFSEEWEKFKAKLGEAGVSTESNPQKYVLESDLSKPGSLTRVCLYQDVENDRKVVLRHIDFLRIGSDLPPDVMDAKVTQAEKLFKRQAQVLPQIEHPNLARVEGFYVTDDKEFFVKREYVPGESLEDLLDKGRRFNEEEVINIMIDIARGLEEVHQYQTIHRDVKPSNVVVTPEGKAVVTDFDILSDGIEMNGGSTCLLDGFTQGYTPPEALDRTYLPEYDVYSLGVLGINLITGKSPLVGGEINQRVNGIPKFQFKEYCNISDELTSVLEKMVEPGYENRYHSMSDVIGAIEGCVVREEEEVNDKSETSEEVGATSNQKSRRSKRDESLYVTLTVAGVGLCALIFGGAVSVINYSIDKLVSKKTAQTQLAPEEETINQHALDNVTITENGFEFKTAKDYFRFESRLGGEECTIDSLDIRGYDKDKHSFPDENTGTRPLYKFIDNGCDGRNVAVLPHPDLAIWEGLDEVFTYKNPSKFHTAFNVQEKIKAWRVKGKALWEEKERKDFHDNTLKNSSSGFEIWTGESVFKYHKGHLAASGKKTEDLCVIHSKTHAWYNKKKHKFPDDKTGMRPKYKFIDGKCDAKDVETMHNPDFKDPEKVREAFGFDNVQEFYDKYGVKKQVARWKKMWFHQKDGPPVYRPMRVGNMIIF